MQALFLCLTLINFRYCIKPKARPTVPDHIDMTDFYDDDYDLGDDYSDDEET